MLIHYVNKELDTSCFSNLFNAGNGKAAVRLPSLSSCNSLWLKLFMTRHIWWTRIKESKQQLTEDSRKTDLIKQEGVQGDRKILLPEWNRNWFVKSPNPKTSAEKSGWCGTPLQQTRYLQKLSVVFFRSTTSEADQLQKLFPCDPEPSSTGFDGASNARLGLSQTGNELCSQMKWGFDCLQI